MITKEQIEKVLEDIIIKQEEAPASMVLMFHYKTYGFTEWRGKLSDRVCSDLKCVTCSEFGAAMKREIKSIN